MALLPVCSVAALSSANAFRSQMRGGGGGGGRRLEVGGGQCGQVVAFCVCEGKGDRKSTRLNSSHSDRSRMPSSA